MSVSCCLMAFEDNGETVPATFVGYKQENVQGNVSTCITEHIVIRHVAVTVTRVNARNCLETARRAQLVCLEAYVSLNVMMIVTAPVISILVNVRTTRDLHKLIRRFPHAYIT